MKRISIRIRLLIATATAILLIPVWVSSATDSWVASKYRPQVEFNKELWAAADDSNGETTTARQRMVRQLVVRVLPGMSRAEIEDQLGKSPKHADMRRYTAKDLESIERDEHGSFKPFPRTGKGHYWEEFDWDLLYYIGREQIFMYDHNGQLLSPDQEVLLIRLDANDRFASWYIDGSTRWPRVVGETGLSSFRAHR